jgi:glycosyltransferase involved in cell wall biosynthesis
MRLLYISNYYKPAYSYGGPATAAARLCEALVRQGTRVTVLTTQANGAQKIDAPPGLAMDVDGVSVHYHPLSLGGLGFFYSPQLAEAVRAHLQSADFVILQGGWGYIVRQAGEAILKAGKPYAIPLHGQLLDWAFGQKHLKKKIFFKFILGKYLQRASFLQCTSQREADGLEALGISTPKVILPYGVRLADYETLPPRGNLRTKYHIPPEAAVLLYLGRLHKNKGPDIAIGTLGELRKMPVHLLLAGSDETGMLPGLIDNARRLGVFDQVHYVGLLNEREVMQAFSDSDLLLVPSRVNENFGMTAVEAMAAGLPVIVSTGIPYGGLIEAIDAGRQVESTPFAFGKATRELLVDREKLRCMASNGRRLVSEEFNIESIARQLLATIQSTIPSREKPFSAG